MEKLQEKIAELEPRLKRLEDDYEKDIQAILEILKKLELRVAGGLGSNEIGLIAEVRDLKKEMADSKEQLECIEGKVSEIKKSLDTTKKLEFNTEKLVADVAILKDKVEKHERWEWAVYGGIVVVAWIISHFGDLKGLIK